MFGVLAVHLAHAIAGLRPHVRAVLQLELHELARLALDGSLVLGRRGPNRVHLLDRLGSSLHVDLGLELLKLGRLRGAMVDGCLVGAVLRPSGGLD